MFIDVSCEGTLRKAALNVCLDVLVYVFLKGAGIGVTHNLLESSKRCCF
jgi:hypothetical protein